MKSTHRVLIAAKPSEKTVARMIEAGQKAVLRLVTIDGALGADEVARRYMLAIYAEVVRTGRRPKP